MIKIVKHVHIWVEKQVENVETAETISFAKICWNNDACSNMDKLEKGRITAHNSKDASWRQIK